MGRFRLDNRTALVTGAAKRLGREIALALAREGANVVVHYRSSRDAAEATCEQLAALGVGAWPLRADLGAADEAEALIGRAAALNGPVEVLVNNASIFDESVLAHVGFDEIVENMAVNAWAPLVLSRRFAAQPIDSGRIVNLLDSRLEGLDPDHVAYILSKHALAQLTRMTAVELAPRITVNAVAPGLVLPPPGEEDWDLSRLAGSLPLQRHGDAGDVADAAVYLIRSVFVTGQVIHVDGGRHLRES